MCGGAFVPLQLDRSWAGGVRDHLIDDLPIDELLPHFDDRLGRPSKDLHIVIGVLLLQQLHDLSDAANRETAGAFRSFHMQGMPRPGKAPFGSNYRGHKCRSVSIFWCNTRITAIPSPALTKDTKCFPTANFK